MEDFSTPTPAQARLTQENSQPPSPPLLPPSLPRPPKRSLWDLWDFVVPILAGWTIIVWSVASANAPSQLREGLGASHSTFYSALSSQNPYGEFGPLSDTGPHPWDPSPPGLVGGPPDPEAERADRAERLEKIRQASLWQRQRDMRKGRADELLGARSERDAERTRLEKQATLAAYEVKRTTHWSLATMIWLGGIVVPMTYTVIRRCPTPQAKKITLAAVWVAGLVIPGAGALYAVTLAHRLEARMCVSVAVPEISPLKMVDDHEQATPPPKPLCDKDDKVSRVTPSSALPSAKPAEPVTASQATGHQLRVGMSQDEVLKLLPNGIGVSRRIDQLGDGSVMWQYTWIAIDGAIVFDKDGNVLSWSECFVFDSRLRIGMSQDEVRRLLGEANSMNRFGDGSVTWHYVRFSPTGHVIFDKDGKVKSWSAPISSP